jgi:hypothetical protein
MFGRLGLGLGLGNGRTAPSGGGGTGPTDTALPAITGTPTSGQTLSVSNGTWTGDAPITYAYQWKADGTAISGATSSTYTLTDAEVGKVITCTLTATNAAGSASVTSAATDAVSAAAPTDPHFANVVFLSGFDGTDGATTAIDDSPSAHAMTFNGNAQIDTAQKKFGTASALFDGSGDYISMADSDDWRLSTANSDEFTIEFYYYPVVTGVNMRLMGQVASASVCAWYFVYSAGKVQFRLSPDGTSGGSVPIGNTINLNQNAWNFITVSKNSAGKMRQWINGALDGSATPANSAMLDVAAALEIGRGFGSANLSGQVDEIRITKGVCRYDTDGSIAVPTAAFPRS